MARFLWTQKQDVGPSPRFGHAMAYDLSRHRTILFGGDSLAGALLGDTWEWEGEYWTQLADTGPSARRDHALAFDAARGVTLLFGGSDAAAVRRDTWAWNGQNWTQLEDTGPSARSGHALAFDAARGQVLLFGGTDPASAALRDTWAWDGTAWTQVEDAGLSPRSHHAMAWDSPRQRIVLFGGAAAGGAALGDTWAWDGTAWTQIEDIGPPPSLRAAMTSGESGLVLFGGTSSADPTATPKIFDDSWVFDGQHWTQRQDIGPTGRWGHAMVRDAERGTIILFGGLPEIRADGDPQLPTLLLGDTWEHVETEAAPGPGPQPGIVDVQGLLLQPTSGSPGDMIAATIILVSPPATTTQLQMVFMLKSIFDAAQANGTAVDPADIQPLQTETIPPGVQTWNTSFTIPPVPEPIIVAVGDPAGGGWGVAELQVL